MPQKKAISRKKGGVKKGGAGRSKKPKVSKPKKATKPAVVKRSGKKAKPKKEKKRKDESKEEGGGGGGEKRETIQNGIDEFKGNSNDKDQQQPGAVNANGQAINTVSKETITQTQSRDQLPALLPGALAVVTAAIKKVRIAKPKRIKDPSKVAEKLQIQGIAASRSLQCSMMIKPEAFMMNRSGATFLLPISYASTNGETYQSKVATDESDTVSTSGDED